VEAVRGLVGREVGMPASAHRLQSVERARGDQASVRSSSARSARPHIEPLASPRCGHLAERSSCAPVASTARGATPEGEGEKDAQVKALVALDAAAAGQVAQLGVAVEVADLVEPAGGGDEDGDEAEDLDEREVEGEGRRVVQEREEGGRDGEGREREDPGRLLRGGARSAGSTVRVRALERVGAPMRCPCGGPRR